MTRGPCARVTDGGKGGRERCERVLASLFSHAVQSPPGRWSESLTSDNIIEIDIAETILIREEGATNAPQAHKRNDDNCYWFATLFNKNDEEYRKTEIIPGIRAACRRAGFKVNCHYN